MSTLRLLRYFCNANNSLLPRNSLKLCSKQVNKTYATAPLKEQKKFSTLKLVLASSAFGAVASSTYTYWNNNWHTTSTHKELELIPPTTYEKLPDVRITKRYQNAYDKTGLEIVLFQFQTCPFCCKVRAFLDYHGISYSVVEVDAVLRQDIKWSKIKKVPMVLIRQEDGKYLQMSDSSAIISLIATYLGEHNAEIKELGSLFPQITYFDDYGKKKMDVMNKYFIMHENNERDKSADSAETEERKWRQWADDHLVHLISPNCYRNLSESTETFEWFSKAGDWDLHFPKWERNLMVYGGASAMWLISKMLKRRHGLSDNVRSHIYDALNEWTDALQKYETPFLAGAEPGLADLSVFGVLSSMEGCQAFKDCLENTNIGNWFYAVKDKVIKNRGKLLHERLDGQLALELS